MAVRGKSGPSAARSARFSEPIEIAREGGGPLELLTHRVCVPGQVRLVDCAGHDVRQNHALHPGLAGDPDGWAVLGRGATASERDGVLFPLAGLDAVLERGGDVTVKFVGEVAFAGDFGLLDVRLADPVLLVRNGTGTLLNGGAMGAGAVSERPLVVSPIRHVEEATGVRRWVASEPLLTGYRSDLFGGAYPPGAPFDPFLASVSRPCLRPCERP